MRMTHEGAEEGWILGAFDTMVEALYHEQLWSHLYKVPDLTFVGTHRDTCLETEHLERIWAQIDSATGAQKLLAARGLREEWPFWAVTNGGPRRRQSGLRNRWLIRAANLIPELMEIPTDPGSGQNPVWLQPTVSVEHYAGTVYSLDVERWHHYVSGGAIVHNCVYIFPDLSMAGMKEWDRGGDAKDAVVRLYYVAMTRAKHKLTLCRQATGFFPDALGWIYGGV